jgi:hypothetical protein
MAEVIKTNPRELDLKDGVQSHLKRLRETIGAFGAELEALKKLEQMLREANDRLDRGASLVGREAQFLEMLIKREAAKNEPQPQEKREDPKLTSIVTRVENDLNTLVKGVRGEPLKGEPPKLGHADLTNLG